MNRTQFAAVAVLYSLFIGYAAKVSNAWGMLTSRADVTVTQVLHTANIPLDSECFPRGRVSLELISTGNPSRLWPLPHIVGIRRAVRIALHPPVPLCDPRKISSQQLGPARAELATLLTIDESRELREFVAGASQDLFLIGEELTLKLSTLTASGRTGADGHFVDLNLVFPDGSAVPLTQHEAEEFRIDINEVLEGT